MSSERAPLPEITLEAAARSFVKQAKGYGFALGDFVRFVNILLGIAMTRRESAGEGRADAPAAPRIVHASLPIAGEHVTLRRFGEPGDRELLDAWVADGDGRFFLLSTASGRIHAVGDIVQGETNLVGMIVCDGRAVGCMAYLDYNADQRRAELRKLIGVRTMRGRGLAREASELWVAYGLGALGLKKIYLNTLSSNIRNIRLNEEIGFRVEGILRNEVRIDGEFHDVLRMGLWYEDPA